MSDALHHDELLAVLRCARARRERDWLMIVVAYSHGLRPSEVVALTADSLRDGFIDVQRRKGSRRTVQPLLDNPEPLLNERAGFLDYFGNQWRGLHNQPIFGVTAKHYWRLFRGYAAQAGIPAHKRHPHALKTTVGTQLAETVPLNQVQRYLGHKSLGSTGRYTVVSDEQASASAARALSSPSAD